MKQRSAGKNRSQLFREIENGAFKPLPSCYSADLTRVLEVCLRTDIEARPYLTELLRSELLSAKVGSPVHSQCLFVLFRFVRWLFILMFLVS